MIHKGDKMKKVKKMKKLKNLKNLKKSKLKGDKMKKLKKGDYNIRLFDWKTCSTKDSEGTMEKLMIQVATKDHDGDYTAIRFGGEGNSALLVSLEGHHDLKQFVRQINQGKVRTAKPSHFTIVADTDEDQPFIKAGADYGTIRIL